MPEYIADADGKWLVQGKARILVEPSAEYESAHKAENEAAEIARAEQEQAERDALNALAEPLTVAVESILERNALTVLPDERAALQSGVVFIASRGKHGDK